VTVKIGGTSIPCTKRKTTSCGTLDAKLMSSVGTTMAKIEAVISRLRPRTSASAPVNGAVSAIAAVAAVINVLISPALTLNSCDSLGNSACGE